MASLAWLHIHTRVEHFVHTNVSRVRQDMGPGYRNVIGIPGGVRSPLFKVLQVNHILQHIITRSYHSCRFCKPLPLEASTSLEMVGLAVPADSWQRLATRYTRFW